MGLGFLRHLGTLENFTMSKRHRRRMGDGDIHINEYNENLPEFCYMSSQARFPKRVQLDLSML